MLVDVVAPPRRLGLLEWPWLLWHGASGRPHRCGACNWQPPMHLALSLAQAEHGVSASELGTAWRELWAARVSLFQGAGSRRRARVCRVYPTGGVCVVP